MAYLGRSPTQGVRNRYYKTASGGETSISGALTGGTLTFTDGNYVDVNLNGVTLVAGTDYNTSTANTIAGLSALTANDVVEIVVYDVFSVFSGNVNSDFSIGGNLTVTGTVDINGGAVDGTTIGAASASTGAFTTISASGNVDFNGDLDVDGTTNLDVVDIDGAVDMASTLQVDGAITSSAGATITTADNTAQLTLKSTDADAGVGPVLELVRDSGSPADSDLLGAINFIADDDGGNATTFASVSTQIGDASDGSESCGLQIKAMSGGSLVSRADFLVSETVFNNGSIDLDFRVETDNDDNAFFVQGNTGDIGISTNSPSTFSAGNGMPTIALQGNDSSYTDRSGALCFISQDGSTGKTWMYQDTDMYIQSATNTDMYFYTGNTERMKILSGGNVDISAGHVLLDSGYGINSAGNLVFFTSNSEISRFDSSGNFLVGKTSSGSFDQGSVELNNTGYIMSARDNGGNLFLSRQGSTNPEGAMIALYKVNTEIGRIGVKSSRMYMGSSSTGLAFEGSQADSVYPISPASDGALRDNYIKLGFASSRFNELFCTNTSINTSDETEKQDISVLTSAEMTAAKSISALFKTYKWKDAVAAKSGAARIHTGVVAQEVQKAMSDAGLDAAKYAFWCSDTWWEVEETTTDDDGEKHTGTVSYQTEKDAPEGATKRTRLGVRYPELLAFIGAATEQRLVDIETRLTALEKA